MTSAEASVVAAMCSVPGLVEHGNAIRIALAKEWDARDELADAWTAAEAIAAYARAAGRLADSEAAQKVADLLEDHALEDDRSVG